MADSREIGKLKIRRDHADRQAAGLREASPGARRKSFLDCLQPQQEAAILADELKPEPDSHGDQQPRQNRSEHDGSHRRISHCAGLRNEELWTCDLPARRPSAGAVPGR